MHKYYFLAASLPPIVIGSQPDLFFEELKYLLDWSLTPEDKEILYNFRQYIDIKNLKRILLNQKIDPRGNLDEKTLNEALLLEEYFPEFVFDFLKKNETLEKRKENFFFLESAFLNYQIANTKNDFLLSYFSLERTMKLVFTALRAKEMGKDILEELKFEDKSDWLVEQILDQRDLINYDPPKGFEKLKEIFVKNIDDPKALSRVLVEYHFEKNNEMGGKDPFTIDQILGYVSNLFLVEDFYNLDEEKGKAIVDSLL
jgi:hypothetical protein